MLTPVAAGPADTLAWPKPKQAWTVLGLLAAAYAVAFLDRVALSLMVDAVKADLKISDGQIGLLQGFAFSVVYSFLGIPLGIMADRYNRVRILVAGLLLWSLANIGCGLSHSFTQLFVMRSLVGIGEAALAPVAVSMISDLFAPQERSKAYGIYVAGNTVGSVTALVSVGYLLGISRDLIGRYPGLLGDLAPWKLVFVITGIPGILLAAVFLLGVRDPLRREARAAPAAPGQEGPRVGSSKWLVYALVMTGGMLTVTCAYALLSWFPTLLMRVHGWTPERTGLLFGFSSNTLGLLSALGSGWVMAALLARGRRDAPILTAMSCAGGYVLLGGVACLAPSGTVSIITVGLICAISGMITASILTALATLTPSRQLGKIVAIYTMLTGIVSMSAGSYLPGLLSDHLFPTAHGIAPALALVLTGASLLALLSLAFGRRLFRLYATPA